MAPRSAIHGVMTDHRGPSARLLPWRITWWHAADIAVTLACLALPGYAMYEYKPGAFLAGLEFVIVGFLIAAATPVWIAIRSMLPLLDFARDRAAIDELRTTPDGIRLILRRRLGLLALLTLLPSVLGVGLSVAAILAFRTAGLKPITLEGLAVAVFLFVSYAASVGATHVALLRMTAAALRGRPAPVWVFLGWAGGACAVGYFVIRLLGWVDSDQPVFLAALGGVLAGGVAIGYRKALRAVLAAIDAPRE